MSKKKKYKKAREQYIEQYEEWTRFLKKKCHYYAVAYLILFFLFPFIFILLFDITIAFALIGCTWFIASVSYFLIFKYYAKNKNEDFYTLLSKSRYGNGTIVSAVFQYSRGGMLLMTILGTIGLYHWLK
jgi:hypothetical protein